MSIMDLKVAAKCTIKQDTGLVVDETGNILPAKFVVLCEIPPFIIIEEGDIDYFMGGEIETVYQVDDQCFEFLKGQVREVQKERSQGFITSVFWALIGSRCKTRKAGDQHITNACHFRLSHPCQLTGCPGYYGTADPS